MAEKDERKNRLFLLMRGWKHGATAAAKIWDDSDYLRGYEAGFLARSEAAKAFRAGLGISDKEAMLMVLRDGFLPTGDAGGDR